MKKPSRIRSLFPLWTAVVAIAGATAISGRFADHHKVFEVAVEGSGPPVILVPGLATTGEVWRGTVERLRDRYQLHVLTLAGFGGPEPIGAPFLPRVAAALAEYVDERRLERPVLVGHSLGGFVSLLAASSTPDRFAGGKPIEGPAISRGRSTRSMRASFFSRSLACVAFCAAKLRRINSSALAISSCCFS